MRCLWYENGERTCYENEYSHYSGELKRTTVNPEEDGTPKWVAMANLRGSHRRNPPPMDSEIGL